MEDLKNFGLQTTSVFHFNGLARKGKEYFKKRDAQVGIESLNKDFVFYKNILQPFFSYYKM